MEQTGILRPYPHSFRLPPSFTYRGGAALSTGLFYFPDYTGPLWTKLSQTVTPPAYSDTFPRPLLPNSDIFTRTPTHYQNNAHCGN